ncbi:MAG: cysteine--tRNA ligase [Actinomycetia bacterium]|nr:cysteine--tRNA ligase [Actinomycetes bacterium]
MQIHDTLRGMTVPFIPAEPGRVSIYVCGPTVQSEPHLGHGRSAVSFDVLRRYLEWSGMDVTFVRNVTDIEDKIIARAAKLGITTDELADQAFGEFSRAYDLLGNLPPTLEPKATEHIPEMVALIEELIEGGHAYESGGDVYFSVRSFDGYGKLSHHDPDDLLPSEGADSDTRKRDPLDFALWKAAKPGEPQWESPWGLGRPGWHIECSAMATRYLGESFDIHAGGTDLIFPHHENEIAQSEAVSGKPFSRYWMHNGMLNLGGEKMAKSTGHVVTLIESLERWDPTAVRLFYLRTNYRKPLDFSEEALNDAESSLARLHSFRRRFPDAIEETADEEVMAKFIVAMDNDLDVAGALAVLFDLVREGNSRYDRGMPAGALVAGYDEIVGVLGLAPSVKHEDDGPAIALLGSRFGIENATVDDLVALRDTARAGKDWAVSDDIRDGLAALNISIEDTPDGARWHRG